ncbi:PIG-L deacetylase family protein [Peptostreptococcus porci]|uniref:PIG-L deacetylase family protein n=1 Tax=Peptostreptococcus porci TaxID=2652282 RepID=UPI002A910458|nr:PIG-L family deacetylase [Peptostreptococcus porci]MDY6232051.1 PIG-L family deacetylase [Peptostreptococcus porci]
MKHLIRKIFIPIFDYINIIYASILWSGNLKNYEKSLSKTQSKKILILSPHHDDETIGMGATINFLSKNNNIDIIFATNGNLTDNKYFPENISYIRIQESNEVSKLLGVKNLTNWNFTNTTLNNNIVRLHQLISDKIRSGSYDIIFAPSLSEGTSDHRTLTLELLHSVIKNKVDSKIYFYDINNSIPLECATDIVEFSKEEILFKKELYSHYGSQIFIDFGFLNKIDVVKGAEYFYRVDDAKELLERYKKYGSCIDLKVTTSSTHFIRNMNYNRKHCYSKIKNILK